MAAVIIFCAGTLHWLNVFEKRMRHSEHKANSYVLCAAHSSLNLCFVRFSINNHTTSHLSIFIPNFVLSCSRDPQNETEYFQLAHYTKADYAPLSGVFFCELEAYVNLQQQKTCLNNLLEVRI